MKLATLLITAGLALAYGSAGARGFSPNVTAPTPGQVVTALVITPISLPFRPITPAGSSGTGCGVSTSVTGTPTPTGSSVFVSASAYLAPNGNCTTTLITRP